MSLGQLWWTTQKKASLAWCWGFAQWPLALGGSMSAQMRKLFKLYMYVCTSTYLYCSYLGKWLIVWFFVTFFRHFHCYFSILPSSLLSPSSLPNYSPCGFPMYPFRITCTMLLFSSILPHGDLSENCPHRIRCLNTFSPIGEIIWEELGNMALLGKVFHWAQALRF